MGPSEMAARYRQYAAECTALAHGQQGAPDALILLAMAQAWLALADQALRNGRLQDQLRDTVGPDSGPTAHPRRKP